MKHYPALRTPARIAGLERAHAPVRLGSRTGLLALAAAFAGGFCAAVWTIGLIVTAP